MKKWFYIFCIMPSLIIAQHKISGAFSPASEFTYAFLYQATPTSVNYINQAQVNPDGSFEITLDASVKKGVYKIVYAVPPEDNNFEIFYEGNEDVELQFDLEKGLSFSSSKSNLLWTSYSEAISKINADISVYYSNNKQNETQLLELFQQLKSIQDSFESQSQGTIAHAFITSNRLYIPNNAEDVETYSQNIISYYFDHVDFSNTWIQSSDYITDRIVAYVFAMPPNETYYKKAIDETVTAIGNNQIIKLTILQELWQNMIQNDFSEVAHYISDTYLLELAKQQNNELLVETLMDYKKTAVGVQAPNFNITTKQSLYDLNSHNNYVLVFWSSSCGHCLNELPILKSFMESYPNFKVVAFGIEDNAESWKAEIESYPEFIHVLGLEKWDNPVVVDYGIQGTPSYFILDKDKTIVAKPDDVEELKVFLEKN
ncbi:TlpA family protein disulfide reductase [Hanstruepera marina]|uniref:TlpA family protein disulfide reductase n=1 Tax=Hanstruepera marina TaxID=2873265 RepID=UPI001CA719B6|nr:TlpA disulfide reductase family protein [Hanstruepera marina]